jgi:hypothetical protein
MWKTRTITVAVASIAITGVATAFAADRHDGDRFDRHEANEQARDVRLDLPRTAAGAVDTDKLGAQIRALLGEGVREIRIRDTVMSAADVQALRRIAARFDFERVRIREDGNRLRVELRNEDRADFRRIDVRKKDEGFRKRVEVRKDDDGDVRKRIEVRRDDDGNDFRERIEVGRDDDRVRNEVRVEAPRDVVRPDRIEKVARVEKVERVEHPDRVEHVERVERPEKAERPERPEHGGDRPDRSGRH